MYIHTSASKDTFIISFESFLTNNKTRKYILHMYVCMHTQYKTVIKIQHSTSINESQYISIILITNIYLTILSRYIHKCPYSLYYTTLLIHMVMLRGNATLSQGILLITHMITHCLPCGVLNLQLQSVLHFA